MWLHTGQFTGQTSLHWASFRRLPASEHKELTTLPTCGHCGHKMELQISEMCFLTSFKQWRRNATKELTNNIIITLLPLILMTVSLSLDQTTWKNWRHSKDWTVSVLNQSRQTSLPHTYRENAKQKSITEPQRQDNRPAIHNQYTHTHTHLNHSSAGRRPRQTQAQIYNIDWNSKHWTHTHTSFMLRRRLRLHTCEQKYTHTNTHTLRAHKWQL